MSQLSKSIDIQVQTQFLETRQEKDVTRYGFAYRITITNTGSQAAKLLNRYWLITDADGKKTEVSGSGVVGQQPRIEPGGQYQYTSGALLDTPVGTMQGHYEFETPSGQRFIAPIAVFSLALPNVIN